MQQTVLTIGHSTHAQERVVDLLKTHGVTALCDVRSRPYSRANPQFNREDLKRALREPGIVHAFMGRELGARSEDPSCHDHGRVQYKRLAHSEPFRAGIRRVQEGMKRHRLALMCAEREPLECHRAILVARHLAALGLDVQHIHADGRLESHAEAMTRLARQLKLGQDLFLPQEELLLRAYQEQERRIAYRPKPASPTEGETIRSFPR